MKYVSKASSSRHLQNEPLKNMCDQFSIAIEN